MTVLDQLNPLKTPDFNGDRKRDVFWRSELTNQNAVWLMDGPRIQQSSFLPSVSDEDGWTEVIPADFNGDRKTDVFWRNTKTGQNAIWLMDGGNIAGASFIDSVSVAYQDFDLDDFNGDGKADIFWRNENTGENAIWLMDGFNRLQAAFLPSTPKEWEYAVAEFNKDGKTDLFWHNNKTGQNAVWLMNGVNISQAELVRSQDLAWDTFQITDFDGDGRTDVFWRDAETGKNQVWIWSESGIRPGSLNLNLPNKSDDFDYQLADFNGDNRIDFLWYNLTTGDNQVWLSGGSGVTTGNLPKTSPGWFPGIVDFNGDNKSDIAWYNVNTGETAAWIIDGRNLSQAEFLTKVPTSQQWIPVI